MSMSTSYGVLENGFAYDSKMRDELRKVFPKEQIGKLPRTEKRPELDYVGHAAVTDRLNQHAPDWFYTVDEMFSLGGVCWVRGTMTIGGVSRPEYGDGKDPKEAIGNFIRRGAMRFGVALDLWSKEELTASGGSSSGESASAAFLSSQQGTPPEPTSVGDKATQSRATEPSAKALGRTSAPTDSTSGKGAGEAGTATEGNGEGPDVAVPSTDDLATDEDWATATKNGLTATKAKAIAKGLGITVANATDLTRADFAVVINKYLEMQAAKK